jgi:hypothetical protein
MMFSNSWVNRRELWCFIVGVATAVGGWLGAIPIPLDWDRPWQVRGDLI